MGQEFENNLTEYFHSGSPMRLQTRCQLEWLSLEDFSRPRESTSMLTEAPEFFLAVEDSDNTQSTPQACYRVITWKPASQSRQSKKESKEKILMSFYERILSMA